MKPESQTWGLVRFSITTDASSNILPSCQIALTEHSKGASHYRTIALEDGSTVLALDWYDRPNNTPLPFDLNTPELMADFIKTWLSQKAVYPKDRYNGDGDSVEGVEICNHTCDSDIRCKVDEFYVVALIIPTYVIYGK